MPTRCYPSVCTPPRNAKAAEDCSGPPPPNTRGQAAPSPLEAKPSPFRHTHTATLRALRHPPEVYHPAPCIPHPHIASNRRSEPPSDAAQTVAPASPAHHARTVPHCNPLPPACTPRNSAPPAAARLASVPPCLSVSRDKPDANLHLQSDIPASPPPADSPPSFPRPSDLQSPTMSSHRSYSAPRLIHNS